MGIVPRSILLKDAVQKGKPSILFIFLKAFLSTGGIEKVNRTLLRALYDFQQEQKADVCGASPYAGKTDERYFPAALLRGYRGRRWRFMLDMLWKGWKADTLLVGHINLAPAAWLLRWRYPRMRIVVMAHGIEVWSPLKGIKRWLLQHANQIIAVSQFTAEKLISVQGTDPKKINVLPNCLDPFFQFPERFSKPGYLMQRYGIRPGQPVLLTISRLNAREGYKGYDTVLACLPELLTEYPNMRYILAGKSDAPERRRLQKIIESLQLQSFVHLPGFLPDKELIDHYLLADTFVMPSKKEGFGLVFIEAMACGVPVVAGNADGSAEALQNGRLGLLVNPDDPVAIADAIRQSLRHCGNSAAQQNAVAKAFNYADYKARLWSLLRAET